MDAMSFTPLSKHKRIVIKIGSSLLVDAQTGVLKEAWLSSLAEDLAALADQGCELVLVSSGAIAMGRVMLGMVARPDKLEDAQAAAAVGQIALGRAYAEALAARKLVAGQVLLTLGDTEARRRYLNARATINTLLARGAIPVVNENDTVATTEIRYGDNDRLAARVFVHNRCLPCSGFAARCYPKRHPPSSGLAHLKHRLNRRYSVRLPFRFGVGFQAGPDHGRGCHDATPSLWLRPV